MKLLKSFLLLIALLSSILSNSQIATQRKLSKDTVVYPNVRIKTDVFILNTCDPLQISLRRKYDDDSLSFMRGKKVRKLEVYSNRLSSFKIEGINPLRYKYYINSEAVTQFMDANAQTLQLSNFLKDGYFISPFDITVPQVFKEDIQRNNHRATLAPFEKNIKDYKDSVSKYMAEIDKIKAETYIPIDIKTDKDGNPIDKDVADAITKAKKKMQPVEIDIRKWESRLNEVLNDYERQIMTLPISSTNISILRDYKIRDTSSFTRNIRVNAIENSIRNFAFEYDNLNADFRAIDSLLNLLNNSYREENYRKANDMLRKYGYTIPLEDNLYGFSKKISIVSAKEFLIKKRYQVFEEFVLGTATKIGIMLQASFREISQKTNSLKLQNCLEEMRIDELKFVKSQISEVFDFVQKTSAEFQILVSYLDIDNKIYSEIVKGINANYYSLLIYLKNIDFIELNNTVEFTLPSSTNLKNIDLVRYKIDREDKVTGGKQSYVYDLWLKGGLKVDFSFGLFASGLVDNEYQKHQYDSLGTLTDSVQINRQQTGGYSFGFGGMVNITPRLGSSWITPGLNFGVIYSTNQKLQLSSGLSLHLGKTERIILHGGVAGGFCQNN